MTQQGLPQRTKVFAVRVIRLYGALPSQEPARVIGKQMLRSGTSVGAHCREAFRPRSDAELLSKLQVALQEADETMYWMELLIEADLMSERRLKPMMRELSELIAIMVASARTVRQHRK